MTNRKKRNQVTQKLLDVLELLDETNVEADCVELGVSEGSAKELQNTIHHLTTLIELNLAVINDDE